MRYATTRAKLLVAPEIVLNLWAYADPDGYVLRIAGKAYALDGSDEEKLGLLRALSSSDFLCAAWEKVPKSFSLVGSGNHTMTGVAHASMLADAHSHQALFGRLMEKLAKEIPAQLRSVAGNYVEFALDLPEDPLCVTTVVVEHADGRLEPLVS